MPALIVEDDREIAQVFALALGDAGLEVEVVHDGRRAQLRLDEIVPDMVLLDLNLPSVSGVELLHGIRASERLAGVKVIVVSANPQMSDEVYDIADLVLIKPVSYEQLRDLAQRFG